jgi:hypothetical protein
MRANCDFGHSFLVARVPSILVRAIPEGVGVADGQIGRRRLLEQFLAMLLPVEELQATCLDRFGSEGKSDSRWLEAVSLGQLSWPHETGTREFVFIPGFE